MTELDGDAYNHRVLRATQPVKSYSEQTRTRIDAARAPAAELSSGTIIPGWARVPPGGTDGRCPGAGW